MAISTKITTSLVPTITQSLLFAAIKAAMTNAGFASTYDDYTSGTDLIVVYELVVDGSKTFGKVYLRIRLTTALVVAQQIFTAWNTTAKTGTNGSTEATYTALGAATTITFTAFNSTEFRLVVLTQGTALIPLGLVVPENKQPFWDLNSWAYGFFFTTASMAVLRGVISTNNPYANSDFDVSLVGNSRLTNINSQTGQPDLIKGLILLSQSNQGVGASFSEDIGIGAFSTQTRFTDAIPPGTSQIYAIIQNLAGGIAIRYT
ncbi:hypothetical protein LC613_13765 [Nostoc sphaeroides CHAB 2801]|uniref:hypothetical protein n=1 Tax=Nostoc sphaeroides TaxID=446679 RepID=UPI000E4D38FE|nr:hypothetical protein [Nostoc sphaeroides]MCC5629083.1 hypothetical protein [Nostoc sphaeroides CHAB 2801]